VCISLCNSPCHCVSGYESLITVPCFSLFMCLCLSLSLCV
jgi:hypothetical protein